MITSKDLNPSPAMIRAFKMYFGEKDPTDKNFFTLRLGQKVYVEKYDGSLVEGTVRILKVDASLPEKMKPCYVIEKEDESLLTYGELYNKSFGFGYDLPKYFNIDYPNHEIVFTSIEEYHKFKISKIQEFSNRYGFNNSLTLADYILKMSEEYPEKFV